MFHKWRQTRQRPDDTFSIRCLLGMQIYLCTMRSIIRLHSYWFTDMVSQRFLGVQAAVFNPEWSKPENWVTPFRNAVSPSVGDMDSSYLANFSALNCVSAEYLYSLRPNGSVFTYRNFRFASHDPHGHFHCARKLSMPLARMVSWLYAKRSANRQVSLSLGCPG